MKVYALDISMLEFEKGIKNNCVDYLMTELQRVGLIGYQFTSDCVRLVFKTEKDRNYGLLVAMLVGLRTAKPVAGVGKL